MKNVSMIYQEVMLQRKKRVAAYARVSSDSDEQLKSLAIQKEHYQGYIESNPDWEFVDVYFDEGVSGTSLKNRQGLKRLIDDCEKGLINLIITKSISRFSRNTIDCLNLVRRLRACDVPIIFEKENIRTDDMDGELMLSILAELAANESKSISENGKWGAQKRFKDGTFIISYPPYGYRNNEGGLEIVVEESEIVIEIFDLILKGESMETIANILNRRNVKTKRNRKWSPSTIRGIIKNEKYIGDALFQKTFTDDNFNRHKNKGEKNSYYIENHHEAIISREIFQKANQVLQQRGLEKGNGKDTSKYSNRYSFSGIIVCGECGGIFKRRIHSLPSRKYTAWTCSTHIENKNQCSMKYVKQDDLHYAFLMMVNKLIYGQDIILIYLKNKLEHISDKDVEKQLMNIRNQIVELQVKTEESERLHYQGYLSLTAYQNLKLKLLQELEENKSQENQILLLNSSYTKWKLELDKLIGIVHKKDYLTEYDDELFLEIVEKIIVLSREKVRFVLKCGLKLEERLV